MNDREHSLGIHFFAFFSLCVIYYVKFIKNCELLDNSYVCTYCTSLHDGFWSSVCNSFNNTNIVVTTDCFGFLSD